MKTEDARYDMKKGERVRDIETALPPLTPVSYTHLEGGGVG